VGGVLRGSWRVLGGQGGILGVSGEFEGSIWGGPGRSFFFFLGGEIADGIVKY